MNEISDEQLAHDAIPIQKDTGPVIELARDLFKRQIKIAEFEALLKEQKAELLKIQTETMPALMRDCGVKSLDLTNGWKLLLDSVFRASLPAPSTIAEADPDEAVSLSKRLIEGLLWLKANKGEDIITEQISIKLGRGQSKQAKAILTLVKKLKLHADQARKIHPGTLSKFLKEKVSAGVSVPFDTFAVFAGDIAVVKPPAKPKVPKSNG